MSNIYAQLKKNTQNKNHVKVSKEEYAKEMQQRRQKLFDMAEKQIYEVVSSPEKYVQFLNLLWRTDYTVTNTLLVMSQKPDSTLLKSSSFWRECHHYIKKGEKGIQILEPAGEYEKSDGSIGTGYKIKHVFDASQINGTVMQEKPVLDVESYVSGLIYDSPVELNMLENADEVNPVLYSPESKCIFYSSGLDAQTLLQGLTREYCHVEFDKQYDNYSRESNRFFIESSSYLVCRKFGIQVDDQHFMNEVSSYFYGMSTNEIKKELTQIRELSQDVADRISRGIYKAQQNRNVEKVQKAR